MENINKLNEILQKINTDIKNLQILDRDFTTYIPRYEKEIWLPYLKFDNNGICSLQFDAKINVLIVYNKEKNQCLFTSPIGPIPFWKKRRIFEENTYFKHLGELKMVVQYLG